MRNPTVGSGNHRTLGAIAFSAIASGAFALLAWLVLDKTNLPAFGGSMLSRAVSTLGSTLVILALAVALVAKCPRWLATMLSYLAAPALVVTTLAIPLSATRLYLDGLKVDQGFRTQFLTRLTDSAQLSDMNYVDLPAYYPGGWFWVGGRLGNLLGLPGWETLQPWSIVSMAMAAGVLAPVWHRLTGSLGAAAAIALSTTAITLVFSAEEPYAAIVAMGIPAAAVMTYRALHGGVFAIFGLIVYLGLSATMYTLLTGLVALSVVVSALVFVLREEQKIRPILCLMAVGFGSLAIAAITWAPYLLAVLSGQHTNNATAMHYLPIDGTQVPLPMLSASVVGVACLIGVAFLVLRFRDPNARMIVIFLATSYCWILLSMLLTLKGTTLLSFRLDVAVALLFATAGILGLAAIPRERIPRVSPRQATVLMTVLLAGAGISFAQNIPNRLSHPIDLAYTQTDGYGERADRQPADATQYYEEIDDAIRAQSYIPRDTVVFTSENDFLAIHPYRGFQAFSSHYANPLGEYDMRNEAIEKWADASWEDKATPESFLKLMEAEKWRAPDVFLFSGSTDSEGWKYDISEDIFPNNPNVRLVGVSFNPEVFHSAQWRIQEIGPFVVVTRVH